MKHIKPRWVQQVKIQLFQNMVMLHIKLKKIINAATWYQLFCLQPSPHPPIHPNQVQLFSEHAHVANQSKGNHECTYKVAHILPADPPPHSP